MPQSRLCTLDTFQMKVLRKIWGAPPTFIDRTNTDESVRQRIKDEFEMELSPLREVLKERRLKLLGHIIRPEEDDPLKEVTFNRDTMEVKSVGLRRVGRPKTHWIHTVMEAA